MLSYKEYMALQESFGSIPLGVTSAQGLGLVGGLGLEEAKKMKKKMMDVPVKDDEEDDDDEEEKEADTGDGEVVDASSEKDEPKDDDVEKDSEEGDEEEDEEGEEEPKGGMMFMKGKMKKHMKAKTSCGKCKKSMSKCMCKKMTKEEREWWNSVSGQVNTDPDVKYTNGLNTTKEQDIAWDGISKPGNVGFSPDTRIGWFN